MAGPSGSQHQMLRVVVILLRKSAADTTRLVRQVQVVGRRRKWFSTSLQRFACLLVNDVLLDALRISFIRSLSKALPLCAA